MAVNVLDGSASRVKNPLLLPPKRDPTDSSDAEILIHGVIAKTSGLKLDCVWGGFDQATEEVFSTFLEEYSKNKDSDKSNIVLRSFRCSGN